MSANIPEFFNKQKSLTFGDVRVPKAHFSRDSHHASMRPVRDRSVNAQSFANNPRERLSDFFDFGVYVLDVTRNDSNFVLKKAGETHSFVAGIESIVEAVAKEFRTPYEILTCESSTKASTRHEFYATGLAWDMILSFERYDSAVFKNCTKSFTVLKRGAVFQTRFHNKLTGLNFVAAMKLPQGSGWCLNNYEKIGAVFEVAAG